MSTTSSVSAGPSTATVTAICAAEILGLAGYSIIPALLPQFISAASLADTRTGWLAGIVSAGYMLAVIPLVGLTDRWPARTTFSREHAQRAVPVSAWRCATVCSRPLDFAPWPASVWPACICPDCGRCAWRRGYDTRPHCGLVHQFVHYRGVIVPSCSAASARCWAGAALLLSPACSVPPGVLIAWTALHHGDSARKRIRSPCLNMGPVFANRNSRPDRGLCPSDLGLRRIAAVDRHLSEPRRRRSGRCSYTRLDYPGYRRADQFSRRPGRNFVGNELSIRYGLRDIATLIFLCYRRLPAVYTVHGPGAPPFTSSCWASQLLSGFIASGGTFQNLTSGVLGVAAPRYSRSNDWAF